MSFSYSTTVSVIISHVVPCLLLLGSATEVSAQTNTIDGYVRDRRSNKPIEYATVKVSGTALGAVTDSLGGYSIKDIPSGFIRLEVSCVGYEQYKSEEIQMQGKRVMAVDILLTPASYSLEDVVVKPLYRKEVDSPVSLFKLEASQIEKTAGVNRDISKLVQTLPGVGATDPNRNDLLVRGGGPAENTFFLDGIEIPIINHFSTQGASGGVVGIINPDFVRSVDFYSGAFPANRGTPLSSVTDISLRNGDRKRVRLKAGIGASDASVMVEGPALGTDATFIVSARQSYLQLLFAALKLPFLPTYNDFQIKYNLRPSPQTELSIIGIGAIDNMRLNTGISSPTESQRYILGYLPVFKQWNYSIGGVYKIYGRSYTDTWVLSRNMLRNTSYKYPDNDDTKPKLFDYVSDEIENKARYERQFTSLPFRLLVGAGLNYNRYTNKTNRLTYEGTQTQEVKYESTMSLWSYQLFLQASKDLLDSRLTISAGVNLPANTFTHYMSNPLNQLSPRLSVAYKIRPELSINANAGRYAKPLSYTTMGYRDNLGKLVNKRDDARFTFSNQVVGGVKYEPSPKMMISLEGFYKSYENYPISAKDGISLASIGNEYVQVGDELVYTTGRGYAYGTEVSGSMQIKEKIQLSGTYTLFVSRFEDLNGAYRPSSWDSRHILNLMATYNMPKNWRISARWRFVGGAPYTPIDMDLSSRREAWDVRRQTSPDYARHNSLRLRAAHQLDLRLDKEIYFPFCILNAYLDIQNVYNFKTQKPPIYTNLDEEGKAMISPSDKTRYVLRPISSTSGTILPTIGVIVKW